MTFSFTRRACLLFAWLSLANVVHSANTEKISIPNVRNFYQAVGDLLSERGQVEAFRMCMSNVLSDRVLKAKPLPEIDRSHARRSGVHQVGELRKFSVVRFTDASYPHDEIDTRLVLKGTHAYVYIDTSISFKSDEVNKLLNIFDTQIYPTTTALFGAEPLPGPDGDAFISIVLYEMKGPMNDATRIGGYFNPADQYSQALFPHSNERAVVCLNLARLNRYGLKDIGAALAHQFQHLLHWQFDPEEEPWVVEGLSEYAVVSNGFDAPNYLSSFLNNPGSSLTAWSNEPRDYAKSFLWILYLTEHFGGSTFARDLFANPKHGMTAIDEIIKQRVPTLSVEEAFGSWLVCNYMDAITQKNLTYSYRSIALPELSANKNYSNYSLYKQKDRVSNFAANYYEFPRRDKLYIALNSAAEQSELRAKLIKFKNKNSYQVEDIQWPNPAEHTWSFLDASGNYSKLVLIPYLAGSSSVSSVDYEIEVESSGPRKAFVDTIQYHESQQTTVIGGLGLPSRTINGNQFEAYAMRFTSPLDGVLREAEIALLPAHGVLGTIQVTVYSDSSGVPYQELDSMQMDYGQMSKEGKDIWQNFDFSSRDIRLKKGENFHIAWTFEGASVADSVFAILDTARIPTDRSSVFVDGRREWVKFSEGYNFFTRAIITIPPDLSSPELQLGLKQSPIASRQFDLQLVSKKPLDPLSVTGTFTVADSIIPIDFVSLGDSNNVFIHANSYFFSDGMARVTVQAQHQYGAIVGRDTLSFKVTGIPSREGGTIAGVNGQVQLAIPPKSISENMFFTVLPLPDEETYLFPPGCGPTGLAFSFGPPSCVFEKMVELRINYNQNNKAMLSESNLAIASLENGQWVVLGGELYRENKSISLLVNSTGSYSLVVRNAPEGEEENTVPKKFYLAQNYPNPFNPGTVIHFGLASSAHTVLRVINLKGQVIATLIDETLVEGEHEVEWDGTDDQGIRVASGMYLYQIVSGEFNETKKLVLVR